MTSRLLNQFLVLVFLAVGGWAALAGPLRRADVAAEPTWVLHINCDALRPTGVGKYLLSEMEKPDVEPKFAAFQGFFSFDPRQQLHGMTFYSAGNAPDDGVMIVYANFDPGRLVALARSARNSEITNYGAHVIYSWLDERTAVGKGKIRFYAAIEGDRIVFGQQPSRVRDALDVLDHAKADLSGSKAFPELGAEGDANFIEASSQRLELPDSAPTAALFRLSKAMNLQVNETNQVVTATLNFLATNESIAHQAAVAVQGVAALAKIRKDSPEVGKLAQALTLKLDGSDVVATIAMPEAEVIDLLKAKAEKDKEKKAEKD